MEEPRMGSHDKGPEPGLSQPRACWLIFPGKGFLRQGWGGWRAGF